MDCVNLGYAKNSVGYRFLVVKSEVPDEKVGIIVVVMVKQQMPRGRLELGADGR